MCVFYGLVLWAIYILHSILYDINIFSYFPLKLVLFCVFVGYFYGYMLWACLIDVFAKTQNSVFIV